MSMTSRNTGPGTQAHTWGINWRFLAEDTEATFTATSDRIAERKKVMKDIEKQQVDIHNKTVQKFMRNKEYEIYPKEEIND